MTDEEMEEQEVREPGDLVAGLDIGTTKVCALIGEVFGDRVELIGVGTAASSGMKKGVVVNIESTVKSIRQAVEAASDMAGCDIESVFVGIAGNHIKGFNSPGIIAINNQEIKEKDIEAVIQAAQTVKISDNQQIIHVLPQEYMVDDHTGIQNPLGMTGVRLVTNVHIVTADVTALHNVVTSCNRAGLNVAEIVLESVASSLTVLGRDEMELGVALIDNQLLEDVGIDGARGILINISAAKETLTMNEFMEASALIQEKAHDDANIIIGALFDESLGEELRVTVIATGISSIEEPEVSQLEVMRARQAPSSTATSRSRLPRILDEEAIAPDAPVSIAKPNLLPKGLPRMPKPIFDDHEISNEYDEPAYLRKKAN